MNKLQENKNEILETIQENKKIVKNSFRHTYKSFEFLKTWQSELELNNKSSKPSNKSKKALLSNKKIEVKDEEETKQPTFFNNYLQLCPLYKGFRKEFNKIKKFHSANNSPGKIIKIFPSNKNSKDVTKSFDNKILTEGNIINSSVHFRQISQSNSKAFNISSNTNNNIATLFKTEVFHSLKNTAITTVPRLKEVKETKTKSVDKNIDSNEVSFKKAKSQVKALKSQSLSKENSSTKIRIDRSVVKTLNYWNLKHNKSLYNSGSFSIPLVHKLK